MMFKTHNKFKYVNSIGQTVEFNNTASHFVCDADFHNYKWNPDFKNGKVSSFSDDKKDYQARILIYSDNERNGLILRDELHNVFDVDVRRVEPGTLYVNGWFIKCYINESKKIKYNKTDRIMFDEITITKVSDSWMKQESFVFEPNIVLDGHDYPYDYEYDYSNTMKTNIVVNSDIVPSDFIIEINGVANNPRISIGENEYNVNVNVQSGETLRIDSRTKTIGLYNSFGTLIQNCFKFRNRDNYVFEKIGTGSNGVGWDGDYSFEVTLIHERSEPEWI